MDETQLVEVPQSELGFHTCHLTSVEHYCKHIDMSVVSVWDSSVESQSMAGKSP